jgi:hypothetical protein
MWSRDTTWNHMTFATRCLDHGMITRGYWRNVWRAGHRARDNEALKGRTAARRNVASAFLELRLAAKVN